MITKAAQVIFVATLGMVFVILAPKDIPEYVIVPVGTLMVLGMCLWTAKVFKEEERVPEQFRELLANSVLLAGVVAIASILIVAIFS